MNNKKSMLKCILASAVAVSSLGTLASAQDMSAPYIREDVSKKLSSPFEQTPFLVKAKSIAKGTRVVLANKQGIPTGAAANVPDVGLREVTGRTNQTSVTLNADKTKYQNIHYSSSWDIFRPAPTLGGAIHSEVNTTITNSIFRNNEAEGRYIIRDNPSYGGGMYIKGNGLTATINNVLFDSNTASSGSGGAIYSAGGDSNDNVLTFNITNATFTNNSATELNNNHGDGGAIYSNGYTKLTISDTDFTSNSAEGDGGAIYNNANNVMSIVASGSDVNFSGNSASGNGGAIYNASGKTINFSTSNDKTINFLTSSDNDIYNVGTITINGDVKVETNISGNGTLNLNSGTFYAKQLSQGRLNLNGGTLSFQESDAKTQNLPVAYSSSSVTTLSGSGNLKIDVNMANGSSDTLSVNSANAGTTLNLSSINVGADYAGSYDSLVDYISYVTGRGRNNITYTINGSSTGQLVTQSSTGVSYTFTLGSNGKLTVGDIHETDEGLKEFIRGILTTNTDNFSFTEDLQLDYGEAVGTTDNSTYTTLNMEMNGHNLTGEKLDGITVADRYTLNLLGDAGTPSTISKFVTAFINEGTLNVQNITFSDNTTAIDNDGTLSLSGTNVFNSNVSGTGSTSITGGSTTVSGGTTFNQNSLSISTDAELANAGTITSAIDNGGTLTNTNIINGDITNTSTLTNTGGTITGDITNSGTVTNSGSITGKLDNTNIVTNTGTITTANGTNSGSITNTNGVINTNGGSNSGSITGGTTNVQGTFSNSGTISSGTVNLKNGATLTQANGGSLNLTSFTNDTNGGTLNLSGNNQIDNVNLGNVALGSVLTANLDINSSTIDSITAGNSSNGVINVILSNTTAPVIDTTYSVINGGGDNLSITLGSTVADKQKVWTDEALIDALGTIYNWSDKAGKYNQEVTDTYHFEVVDKHNLAYVLDEALRERGGKEYTGYYDLLQKLNQSDASTREFNAASASETYTVKDVDGVTGETITGLGTTGRGKLTVNGVASGNNKSTIDGNGKTLFELTQAKDGETNTQVIINNTKIINAAKVATVSADNELTLNNVEISGNTSGITNNGDLIFTGNNTIANVIDGNNGAASVNSGITTLSADLTQGTLDVLDSAQIVNNANIRATVTNAGTITNNSAIYTLNGSNSGTISGGRLNISGTFDNSGVLSNSVVNVGNSSQLNYATNSANASFSSTLVGSNTAKFNKSGSTELQISGNQSGFEGTVNINEGALTYSESSDNRFFDSSAIINVDNTANADSTLKYTSISGKTLTNGVLPAINLKNGATFEYNAGTGETVIGNGFYNSVSGSNNLIFNGGNSDRIVLNSDFNSNDTATFNGANLALGSGLSTIASSIILDNTSLNLMNSSVVDYTINGLSSLNNSKVNVDVSLGAVSAGDRLLVENGSGVLNISQFRIVDDNGLFTTDDSSKTVQIIKNGSNSSLSLGSAGATIDGAWSTNVYEYQISSAKTDTDNDSLKFTGVDVSDANSLKKMNNYDNSTEQNIRGFSVVRGASPYHIGEDLGKTEHGTFVVNGVSKDKSVISGVRAEGDWTSAGEKGSMFELTETEKTTDFNLSNVTVEDAQVSSRGGAVVYSTSDKADITISDVIIQNNTSSGRGGAFDIENAHSVSISNSEFKGNASDGLGGAIYSAVDLSVSNTDFSNNTAQNSANDIYLANGADLLYTTGAQANTISGGISSEISQSVFTKLGSSDLNISGSNSGYKGSVNINEGNLNFVATSAQDSLFDTSDSSINIAQNSKFNIDDKGLTNLATSNLNGKGTIDKNGAGVLNVTGDNDNFIGVVNIKSGEISYKEQGEGASFFDASAINMSANTVLSVETTSQNNIQGGNISSSGSGTVFNKSGSGSFDLTGKNTVGSVNVQQGILNVADNAAGTRTYNAGATSISENATLNYTVDKNSELTNLSGNGNLVKQGGSKLELSDYTFSGLAQVQNGILDVTSSSENATDLDFNVEVYGNSEFDYNAGTNAQLTLNNNGKFAFDTDASGAKAVFNNAKINLGEIANVAGNTVVINNSSEIALTASNYLGSYEFTNSVLDVMDSDVSLTDALKTYTFNNLTVNNSDLTIDVSLGNNSGSDVLNIVDGSGNLRLTKLAITEDNGIFDNEEKTKTFQIINNTKGSVGISLLAGDPKLADWSTTIYEYEINAVKSDDQNDYYDSVEFKGIRIASPDTLRIMNHERNGSRGFSVVGSNIYHIARDLDETFEGDFVVIGNGKDVSTISGNRVSYTRKDDGTIDISAPIEGEYGSFFELTKNNTKLTVQDLTIQEAQRKDQAIKDGSVLYLNNGKSEAVLNNVVFKDSSAANGGAIANINSKSLAITNSDFTGNSASANGGVIYNTSTGTSLTNITADGNKADGKGGAIYTNADMLITNSAFGANSINQHKNGNDEYAANDIYIDGENAKVTFNATGNSSLINSGIAGNGTLEKTGDGVLNLHGNNADFGGVLKVSNGEVLFSQNSANDTYVSGPTNISGGAKVTLDNDKSDITAGSFSGEGDLVKDGSKDLTLTGDNSGFSGKVDIQDGSVIFNADDGIKYFGGQTNIGEDGELVVNSDNGTSLSQISGNGTMTKNGDGDLTLNGNNSGFNGDMNINGGALNLASGTTLGNIGNATFADGTAINLQNTSVVTDPETGAYTTDPNPASIESLSFNNLVINGKVDFKIDVDLYNEKADNIHADQVTVNNDGYLSIGRGGLNVVTDAKSLVRDTIVQIASGALAQDDYIRLESDARTVMGPIQKYDVTYGNGNLTFAGQGGDRPDINSVNPAIMASPVATQIGGFLTQSQMLQDGFFHMNRYTKYAHSDRFAAENINKYAIETGQMPAQASPLPETSQGMWIKPYATYEKVGLRNGYKVENFAYGSMYGGDGDMFDMGHGWKGVISAFVGYNGNHMNYNGISMDMQGGSLGATGTFYKGNFFTGITVSTGASAGEAYTQYGTDRFSMLTAGIANKTGYNIEINDGKLIVQPTLFTGYTFVNTFDYTNAAGVRMDSDPLHAIQIIPGVKIIGNLENGWQPYAGVDMVWNIMDRTNVMANDVRLPQMSVKPYVQYGVGVQKSWGDKFTAFVQTMFRGGGRNGVAFTAGFRWVFGKEKKKVDPNYVPVKKVIKKL